MSDTRVTGIGGVFLRAQNPRDLARWYSDRLGVPVEGDASTTDDSGSVSAIFRWRRPDGSAREGMTVWALFPKDSTYIGDGPCMINYLVDDLDKVLEELAADGVWVDPKREEYGYGRFAWIRDPEGNRIELWQPLGE